MKCLAGALSLAVVLGLAAVARAADPPSEAEIQDAIQRGMSYLRSRQENDGHWSFSFNYDHTLGVTALAGLALLENGVDRDDPAIVKADRVVRGLATRSRQTYDIALAILFLARRMPTSRGPDDDLIRRLGERLLAGESQGMWTYGVPEPKSGSIVPRNRASRRRQEVEQEGPGDHSNTQFALLGVWAATRHGLDGNEALAAIDDHFRSIQNRDGSWGYVPGQFGTPAMTCAGLLGLAIPAARPKLAEKQTARARGAALAADDAFKTALKAVAREASRIDSNSDIYYLWSVERVCVALGLKQLDGVDWYSVIAAELLHRQRNDGSWPESRWGSLPDTCLALLVLRKANLAFELERVLKLPGPKIVADRPDDVAPVAVPSGDAVVTVRQADEANFPIINLDFEVKNPGGAAILDAAKSDFRVTEYGQDVEILRFRGPQSKEERATTVVLVLDRSKSMEEEDRIGGLKRAVASFLQNRPEGSRIAVIAFGNEVELICPFTDDAKKVQSAVDALTPAGATRYYDAVAEALKLLASESGRRAILAMTDGEDTFSQAASLDGDVRDARREGVPVHTLGLGSEDEIETESLKKLAADSRGQAFSARQADGLKAIFEELARNLGQSYSLSYRSDRRQPDGTLRPIRVFYRKSSKAGEAEVYIPGMVVPAGGSPWLFLALVAGLATLAVIPGRFRGKSA